MIYAHPLVVPRGAALEGIVHRAEVERAVVDSEDHLNLGAGHTLRPLVLETELGEAECVLLHRSSGQAFGRELPPHALVPYLLEM